MEIGDRCSTALDEFYSRYASFVTKTYGFEPAPQAVWIRVERGISNRSHNSIRLISGVEHQRRKLARARAAANALAALSVTS